jgi:hypothetical protein
MPDFFHDYQICEKGANNVIEGLRWFLVELPKFRPVTNAQKRYLTFWLRYFTEINDKTEQAPADLLEIPEIRDAIASLEISAYSAADRATYHAFWDSVSSNRTLLSGKFAEGKAEGKHEEKVEIALALLARGIAPEFISETTKLSPSEIQKLSTNPQSCEKPITFKS